MPVPGGGSYAIAVDFEATRGPSPRILPNVWLGPAPVVTRLGVAPGTGLWNTSWGMPAPACFGGLSMIVQAAVLTPYARNGLYETIRAHRFLLQ
ncbi:MAG: hypothetical protein U1E73_04825 [Planctomycetota bacterium]